MKAYLMYVTDRSQRIFLPNLLSMRQLDDYIAIVQMDGKDTYYDPGERYCTFQHLAWHHSLSSGLRQVDGGKTAVVNTPSESYTSSRTSRVADLALDDHGVADGTVTFAYTGNPALHWRQRALRGDDTSLNQELRESLEHMLPGGMEVRVVGVADLTNPDKPLTVKYTVKGAVGSSAGRRLLLPQSLFEINHQPDFTQTKRELAVDMHFPQVIQDAVRFTYPASETVESAPPEVIEKMNGVMAFTTSAKQVPGAITLYRNYTLGKTFFTPQEYGDLRVFYGKLESKQAESVVLTHAPAVASSSPAGN